MVATSDQNNTTALNAFAFYASATGGSPKIYGLGAMEAYVRLPGGTSSEFYLAQIDAIHAGKTMVVNLWDPGDTGSLGGERADPPADRQRVHAGHVQVQGHGRDEQLRAHRPAAA